LRVTAIHKEPMRHAKKLAQKAWAQGNEAEFADNNSVVRLPVQVVEGKARSATRLTTAET
jgi:hypothetical protein